MSQRDPIVGRYLQQFEAGLDRVAAAERNEIVREIENHIAEASKSGKSTAEVLGQLGPADRLAKAYTADALLSSPPPPGSNSMTRWWSVAGLLITTSLPSLVLIPMLGGVGLGFTFSGVACVVAGIAALFMPWLLSEPFGLPFGVPQVIVIVIGVVLTGLGIGSLSLLVKYFKFLIRTIRKVASVA